MKRLLLFMVLLLWELGAIAAPSIAVLDFELKDLTLAPNGPQEVARTASIKAQLETELRQAGYAVVSIPLAQQQQAEAGVGYLFAHHDQAALLGQQVQADYVLVGRLHKPSFLFAYMIGHLIRVKDARLLGDYTVETKGGDPMLTHKAVETLTVKIDQDLERRYTPPPPL